MEAHMKVGDSLAIARRKLGPEQLHLSSFRGL